MLLTTAVALSDVFQSSGTLMAYAGTAVRGVQDNVGLVPFGPYTGKSVFNLIVRGDTNGDTITFKFRTGSGTVDLQQSLVFTINGILGDLYAPEENFVLSGAGKFWG